LPQFASSRRPTFVQNAKNPFDFRRRATKTHSFKKFQIKRKLETNAPPKKETPPTPNVPRSKMRKIRRRGEKIGAF
jgi:hypothetical protein